MSDEAPRAQHLLPHILVVDDDDRIRGLVAKYLKDHNFFVSTASSAKEATQILQIAEYDALVLDVMMPGQSGMELTKELRQNPLTRNIPVLLLTAMGETEDKIEGLSVGADDYLTKPFDPRELVLRLQAILRRQPLKAQKEAMNLQIGPWQFNPQQSELTHSEMCGSVKLTDVEANLLKALASRVGEIMSREELSEICDIDAEKRTIDVQVTRLRRKLEEDSNNPRYLQTVRGKGYILRAEMIAGE
ncbi:MAG: response regulator transcription factor [Alphaproteobacteria bacterium]|nr:response regulator transcription factor [Alphaproteobacteria bacterium]